MGTTNSIISTNANSDILDCRSFVNLLFEACFGITFLKILDVSMKIGHSSLILLRKLCCMLLYRSLSFLPRGFYARTNLWEKELSIDPHLKKLTFLLVYPTSMLLKLTLMIMCLLEIFCFK